MRNLFFFFTVLLFFCFGCKDFCEKTTCTDGKVCDPFTESCITILSPEERNDMEILDYLADNNLTATKTNTGLYYQIIKEGDGNFPSASDVVTVNYEGKLLDETIFDGNQYVSFALNQVIAGWTEGVQLIDKGGIIVLYIPSQLAYGENGTGQTIPPYAVLIFEIELLYF